MSRDVVVGVVVVVVVAVFVVVVVVEFPSCTLWGSPDVCICILTNQSTPEGDRIAFVTVLCFVLLRRLRAVLWYHRPDTTAAAKDWDFCIVTYSSSQDRKVFVADS